MLRRLLIVGVVLSISIGLRVEARSVVDPGVYCQQLVSFFDYYGASRTKIRTAAAIMPGSVRKSIAKRASIERGSQP